MPDPSPDDLLGGVPWSVLPCPPGRYDAPADLPSAEDPAWLTAAVPGTAAGSVRRAGQDGGPEVDERDWWFCCVLPEPGAAGSVDRRLELDGLATIADVWLVDTHLLHSESMWTRHRIDVGAPPPGGRLTIRCSALGPRLRERHPRPRWKTPFVTEQSLRWWRTSLQGRTVGTGMPPVVGPWRPVRLVDARRPEVTWTTRLDGGTGIADVTVALGRPAREVLVTVGGRTVPAEPDPSVPSSVRATVELPDVRRWWPHTHGDPALHAVEVTVDGVGAVVGHAGFRELTATGPPLSLAVNGVPVFARGCLWSGDDAVDVHLADSRLREALVRLRDAGVDLLRISGTAVYQDDRFHALCDELGIMVWQDLMFARLDPPDDPAFDAVVEAEVGALCTRLAASPSTAVVCGGSEVHQQPAMLGLPAGRRAVPLLDDRVPQWVHRRLPATPYLPSSPYGDGLAFRPGGMATHYFGVGAYGRPVQDALLAGVGFASECLAFAVPPGAAGRRALDDADPDGAWRARVPQDSGADWTFADVTERYARRLAGAAYPAEPADPDLAHDLAGATAATVMAAVVAGWRAPGSGCRGALLIASHDQVAGSGWGLIDAAGMPKAAYWGVRRVMAPVALLLLDRGLDGLRAVVVNDGPEDLAATLTVRCLQGDRLAEHAGRPITVPAHGSVARDVELLLDGFRDLTHAYGFGPPAYSCVEVVCESSDGRHIGSAVYVPGGSPIEAAMAAAPAGPVVSGRIVPAGSGAVALEVAATGLAIAVEVDAPGWDPADSWFDLAPGSRRTVELRRRHPGDAPPVVTLRPLGSPPVVLGSAGAGS